mgnify:FL=1|jgi:hypothetical protein
MKIWKIKKVQIKEVLETKGYFFCNKYKHSHDKARTIMRKLCKEGLAEKCPSPAGQVDTVCIRAIK